MKPSRKTYFRFQRMSSCGFLLWNLYPRRWVQEIMTWWNLQENFEKEVVRTRPHKPRSNVFVASNPRVPSRIQYQAKDHQQFVRAISINKYLTTRTECFTWCFLNISLICHSFSHLKKWHMSEKKMSFLISHSFGFGFESSASTALAAAIALAAKSAASLWALKHIMRWGETLHLKVKHDETSMKQCKREKVQGIFSWKNTQSKDRKEWGICGRCLWTCFCHRAWSLA